MADSISAEEKLKIATKFMLNAPPGEFNEVVTDVRSLVNDDALLNRNALSTFRTYNTDQMISVSIAGNDSKVLVTTYGEIDQKHYLDPHSKQVFEFDHVMQTVGGVSPADDTNSNSNNSNESLRSAIDAAVSDYVAGFYPEGACAVYNSSNNSSNGKSFVICISAKKFNPKNYWNGRWRSVWTATLRSSSSCELQGSIRVNVHYYEDGNVQLSTKHEKTTKVVEGVSASDDGATARAIALAITRAESDFQGALDEGYHQMSDQSFKSLRRKLPVSGVKVNFEGIAQHKMNKELGGGNASSS